jgi:hypothetical protein
MAITQNALGISLVRLKMSYGMSYLNVLTGVGEDSHYDCFFEHVPMMLDEIMPQANIVDYCNTWDLDTLDDIMPEVVPFSSGHWEIDPNNDAMPESY